ncbi:MAG TPA: LegC family aminotransferase [Pyrinomonadaceae bacterium]|nr:LegC family aminotransferase [Pyrinomonadaceae bacterium]
MKDTSLASMPSEPGAVAGEGVIPLCVPEIRGKEWDYIKECLDTNWVSSVGPFVDRFERMLAGRAGTAHAIAAVNGTSALHIALLVAGVQPDDEVLTSTLTFIAPANAIRYAGAWPVLVDAERHYWQMDPQRVVDFLDRECRWTSGALINNRTGRRVRAIVPVHILGHPVDVDPILEAARKYELAVIEDATESLGAVYKGRRVGGLGDIGCFSFNGNKIITTGGGGMLCTNDAERAGRAKYLTTQAKDDPVEYVHGEVGYNYRLTNIQAALGCAQMEQLDQFIVAKRRLAARYTEAFGGVPGITPMPEASWANSIFWMYTILVDEKLYGEDSRALLRRLAQRGIQARPLWQPLHQSKVYEGAQVCGGEVAAELNARALSLPCSVGLTEDSLGAVIEAVRESSVY